MRADTARDLASVNGQLARAQRGLAVLTARGPRPRARKARADVQRLVTEVQKARAAVESQDYQVAQGLLSALKTEFEAVLPEIEGRPAAQSPRRAQ
jgi:hypothetical protein